MTFRRTLTTLPRSSIALAKNAPVKTFAWLSLLLKISATFSRPPLPLLSRMSDGFFLGLSTENNT